MDELVGQLALKAGIDDVVAEKGIGITPGFPCEEGPSAKVQVPMDSAGLAELMGGGLMAFLTELMKPRLLIGEIQNIARELFGLGRDKIGAGQLGKIIAETPGLSRFG